MIPRSGPGGPGSGPGEPGTRRPPGGIWTASGVDVGPPGLHFPKLPALVAKPSGEQAQAQEGSVGHAKRLQFAVYSEAPQRGVEKGA